MVISQLWILLEVVAQLAVMNIFSWSTPVLLYWYPSVEISHEPPATFWLLVFPKVSWCLGKAKSCEKKIFGKLLRKRRTSKEHRFFFNWAVLAILFITRLRAFLLEVYNLLWLSLTSITTEDWTGLRLSGMDWTALYFTRSDCLRLRLTSPDSTTLQYPGLKRKVPYSTAVHCTSPDWSA